MISVLENNLNCPVCTVKNGSSDTNLDITPDRTVLPKRYVIYIITNKNNGKQYIGRTFKLLKVRWNKHCTNGKTKNCVILVDKIIIQEGEENFEIKEILECDSFEEMCLMESMCILLFNTLVPNGYNQILHSYNGFEFFSADTREKLSFAAHSKARNTKDFNGVFPSGYKGKWYGRVAYQNRKYGKSFNTKEEAAEFVDIVNYHSFGDRAILNLPNKKEEYKIKINDKEFMDSIFNYERKYSSKYMGVVHCEEHNTFRSHIRKDFQELYIGSFRNEIEAALNYDKMYYYLYKDTKMLNFPERLNEYINDDLERLYNQYKTKLTNAGKIHSKFRGVTKGWKETWRGCIKINGKLTRQQFNTEIEAARFYDRMAIEHFGLKAKTNFPKSDYLNLSVDDTLI